MWPITYSERAGSWELRGKTWGGGGGGCARFFFFFGPWARDRKRETLHLLSSRKRKAYVLSTKIGCLTRVARSPRYRNSHTRLVRREITYLVLDPDNIGDVTDALRYSNEIPSGPLPFQNLKVSNRGQNVLGAVEEGLTRAQSKKRESVMSNGQFSYASFRHAILISVSLDCCEVIMFVALRSGLY
jgi:hypothetical protein